MSIWVFVAVPAIAGVAGCIVSYYTDSSYRHFIKKGW